jgi:hypothetical protein
MPNGAIVVINHRMHEDDLPGRLLAHQAAGGDSWEVVELPAISATNEALWPEAFSALYQQQPAPEEGDYFKAEWLRPYDKAPPRLTLRIYGASDYAVTADGGDYTVHIVVGINPEWRMYVLGRSSGARSSYCRLIPEPFKKKASAVLPSSEAVRLGEFANSKPPAVNPARNTVANATNNNPSRRVSG